MTAASSPGEGRAALGVFVKTPSTAAVELLGLAGFDFGVVDAEHAPFSPGEIDMLVLAGRAAKLPLLLRPSQHAPDLIQAALDSGAAGIVAPHIDDPAQARALLSYCKFKGGSRGYSSSTRSAGFGSRPMADVITQSDKILVICQIETPRGVENAEAIARLDGVDGLLIGRADLAVSMGETAISSPAVRELTLQVIRCARNAGKLAGVAAGNAKEAAPFATQGANWFILSSDQGLLRQAAEDTVSSFVKEFGYSV